MIFESQVCTLFLEELKLDEEALHMNVILKQPFEDSSAWNAKTFANDESWIYRLAPHDIEELHQAMLMAKSTGKTINQLTVTDFPLSNFSKNVADFKNELEDGRGFLLLRGLPIENYDEQEINIIYYGIGLHLGQPVTQNGNGDLLGQVMNTGDINDKNTRVYQTNLYLPYHTDPSDVVGLLCVRQAKEGGLSSLVSVPSVYNILLKEFPEYLGLFYKQWYYAHLGEDLPSPTSLFAMHEGKLNFRYLRQYIELGHEIRKAPLSDVEREALDILDSIIMRPELRIDMMLEPGDIQLANNHLVLHSRTSFVDHDDINERRKLLRLWLKMSNARTPPASFPGRNGFGFPNIL